MNIEEIQKKLVDMAVAYGPKLLLAILTLVIGLWVIKAIGRGIRSANIFAENQSLFASSRASNILSTGGTIYGLDPEIA